MILNMNLLGEVKEIVLQSDAAVSYWLCLKRRSPTGRTGCYFEHNGNYKWSLSESAKWAVSAKRNVVGQVNATGHMRVHEYIIVIPVAEHVVFELRCDGLVLKEWIWSIANAAYMKKLKIHLT